MIIAFALWRALCAASRAAEGHLRKEQGADSGHEEPSEGICPLNVELKLHDRKPFARLDGE